MDFALAVTEGITVCHKDEPHDTYGGRGTNGRTIRNTEPGEYGWLGNPYRLDTHGDRAAVIGQYVPAFYHRLRTDRAFRVAVSDLAGQRVACWCRHADEDAPACHLDVLDHFLRGGRVGVREFVLHDLDRDAMMVADGGEVDEVLIVERAASNYYHAPDCWVPMNPGRAARTTPASARQLGYEPHSCLQEGRS